MTLMRELTDPELDAVCGGKGPPSWAGKSKDVNVQIGINVNAGPRFFSPTQQVVYNIDDSFNG